MKKNAFLFGNFYEEINADAIKILAGMLKNKKVRYFIVRTYPFEYTVSKVGDLENPSFLVGKETGYKYIKKKYPIANDVIDFFKNNNEAIEFIKKTNSVEYRGDAVLVYARPYGQQRDEYREQLLEKRPKQINLPEKDKCPVCLDYLSDGRPICKPHTCEHIFHCDCLSNVRPNKKGEILCPLCREDTYGTSTELKYVSNLFGKSAFGKRVNSCGCAYSGKSAFGNKKINCGCGFGKKVVSRGNLKTFVKDLKMLKKL